MEDRQIKVLIVEDSSVVQMLLAHILNSDPRVKVIGTAGNGREALQFLTRETPDVILMDINMPEMNGLEATRRIMESHPIPIIICSSTSNPKEAATTFHLMEVGAVACVEKPIGIEHADFAATAASLLETVKLMSEVKVVRRWPPARRDAAIPAPTFFSKTPANVEMVGIGVSTGGPPVIQAILTRLPHDFHVPIMIVQHITPGFLNGLIEWLNQTTAFKVQIAVHGDHPLPGHVYLAPDDCHMAVRHDGRIVLEKSEPEDGLRPSVAHLFHSLAEAYGPRAVGVLLTGMGRDGAKELKQMRDAGAITIAQDRETSVVHGMPGEAIALGAASYVLPRDGIAPALVAFANHHALLGSKTHE